MSNDIVLTSPTLSYVGAVDISSENQGKTLYNILFDSTLNTLANVLMFEYKLQAADVEHATKDNVEFGYVEHSNFHSGIVNQWQISIPSRNNVYNPNVEMTIQVRVYAGVLNSSNVVVTEWSNPLNVHNPPNQPKFFDDTEPSAIYDIGYGSNLDDLYVFLDPDDEIDYSEVKYLVAYYFTNDSDVTVWDVSEQLTAQDILIDGAFNAKMLKVPNFGKVSSSLQVVYVSVYAVYKFVSNDNSFYSVSEVTSINEAQTASYFSQPNLPSNAITYHIYDSEPEQEMTIQWTAPINTYLPIYNISRYVLEMTTDEPTSVDATWNVIDDNITNTYYNYSTPINNYPCGTTLSFRVLGIDENDNISPYSVVQSINMFKYASAPQNLSVTETSVSNGINMRVQFDAPNDNGCGEGYRYIVKVDGVSIHSLGYGEEISYGNSSYDILLTNLNVANSGIVEVFLETYNTNNSHGPSTLAGASTSVPYIAYTLSLDSVVYDVYTDRTSQIMNLSWNGITDSNWTVVDYEVEKSTNGGAFGNETNTSSVSHEYNAATNDKEDSLSFKIIANMSITYNTIVYTYSITSNEQSINVFKYATAPQNLVINNTTTDGTDLTSITISFDDPSDIGSGVPYQYVINVAGDLYYIQYGNSTTNVTLDIASGLGLSGLVIVLLETINTNYLVPGNNNQGPQYLNGEGSVLPFASSNISFNSDNIVYKIYEDKTTQVMELSWSPVLIDSWSVVNYSIMVDAGSGFVEDAVTTGTNYNFTSSQECDTLLRFKIVAHMLSNNGSTTYDIESNIQTKYIFKYATAPTSGSINWAVADINTDSGEPETMNLNINFTNSNSRGCGSIVHYEVDVFDISYNKLDSQTVTYNETQSVYEVNFDINSYTPSGHVNIYLKTTDTNSENQLEGVYKVLDYTTTQLPYYINQTIVSSNLFSFDIITQSTLLPNATFSYQYTNTPKDYVDWRPILAVYNTLPESTLLSTYGVAVVRTTEDNGEFKYSIKMNANIINRVKNTNYTELPEWFAISTSNQAGVATDITVRV
jgi:hypothetical protein